MDSGINHTNKLTARVATAFERFAANESSSGILLIAVTVAAFAWANSPWGDSYFNLWQTKAGFSIADFELKKSLHHWINDGLMVLFFFLVGLEIKREVLVGELNSFKKAMLPMSAALGGMLIPAVIYFALNRGAASADGWAIPMATDIAFALAVLALLGKRVPLALKVFLTALAIVDDLGAVLVIALFYTSDLNWLMLGLGGAVLLAAFALNYLGIQSPLPYALLGILLWFFVFQSGVHATVAGVLLALTIPARPRIDRDSFASRMDGLLKDYNLHHSKDGAKYTQSHGHGAQDVLHSMQQSCTAAEAPLVRLEHSLAPWVAFAVVPLFALANAGVNVSGGMSGLAGSSVVWGVALGLLLGKVAGVSVFSWLAVRLKIAYLPAGVTWRHILGTSLLCGIGFTMSLFIASLAFGTGDLLDQAKVGILLTSLVAGLLGFVFLAKAKAAPA